MTVSSVEDTATPIASKNYSQEDLESIYSGGDCYQLALWLHQSNPDRFELWEAASPPEDGTSSEKLISNHWFVRDTLRNVFIDVYGDCGLTPESVLEEWPDFVDVPVQYFHWTDASAARARMFEQFSDVHEKAFTGPWEANAQYVSERLSLVKPA